MTGGFRAFLLIAGASCLAQSAPASAARASKDAVYAKLLREYASCMALAAPGPAVKLLQSEPGSRLERLRLQRFVSRARLGAYCWPAHEGPPTNGAIIRGAMAEALYRSDFPKLPPSLARSAPAVRAASTSDWSMDAAAACVVANNAVGVDTLLRRVPGTAEEEAARTALNDSFAACGQRPRWGAIQTRGALAQALYARARGWGTATAGLGRR